MSPSAFHLAQVNIARLLAPLTDPGMADFVANLPQINAIADRSPGFVWRFQTEEGDATAIRPYEDDRIVINFSVWEDLASLQNFVYRGAHSEIMKRRREWFARMADAYIALWWVPAGHRPTLEEAVERMEHLKAHGPSPHAFTLREFHPPPESGNIISSEPLSL
ncbi:MAG TPA: DUF3291 domain-containing protein [Vicinamibacterales bacterium]